MRHPTWTFYGLLTLIPAILCSPFELTDQYVEEVSTGIEDLKKLSSTYDFKEPEFNPAAYNETQALKDAKEYDFIIIGAGTSGSVIANRLTEVPEWKVLLLEAGSPETIVTQIPSMTDTLKTTPYNWGYKTTPQESWCLGTEDHRCPIPAGRALGGSTAINSMLYTRGNPRDYDAWADLGNDGWCHKDVFPYFLKSENANLAEFDRRYHKQGGPLHVEDPQYDSGLSGHFLEAAKEAGLKVVDYNGKEQMGYGVPQATTKSGRRNSVASAYLVPIRRRRNLTVKPLSAVIKIIISPHTKEAYGVKYVHGEELYIAKAAKEVIVAAGALNTPKLLLLSGVGPKEELEKLDIHLVQNLPVGKGLKDHAAFLGVNYALDHDSENNATSKDDLTAYLKNGKGPLTSIRTEGIANLKTDLTKDKLNYPDIQLLFLANTPKPHTFTIAVVQTQPKSSGTVTLKSKNPFQHPSIDLNHLSDPDDADVNTLVGGIRKAVSFAATPTFEKLGARLNREPVHGCEQDEFDSDGYWKCAVRFLTVSQGDVSGTARMGPETDGAAVVDRKLRVHGVHKLRVADASVIPVSVAGNLHAPVVMVGEKAADLVKEDWH